MNSYITFAGNREIANKPIRLDIRKGHFTRWMGQGQQPQEYDFVQGNLIGRSLRKRETQAGEMTYIDLHFANGDNRFDVSSIASGSVSAELVSKLVNIRDVRSTIRIDVWAKDQFTNCSVHENGERLPFQILPKVVRNQRGFNAAIDSSERDAAVLAMINELNSRIAQVRDAEEKSKEGYGHE